MRQPLVGGLLGCVYLSSSFVNPTRCHGEEAHLFFLSRLADIDGHEKTCNRYRGARRSIPGMRW